MGKHIKEHCYIMSKKVFKNKKGCRRWFKLRNIILTKSCNIKNIDKDFIVFLRNKSQFNKKTLKRKYIRKGVKCINGYLK